MNFAHAASYLSIDMHLLLRNICFLTSLRAFRPAGPCPAYRFAQCAVRAASVAESHTKATSRGETVSACRWRLGSAASAPQAAVEAAAQPQTPLCEREPAHTADLQSLLDWRQHALAQVEAVGNSWLTADQGPSAEDLKTELSWLLDNTLAGLALHGQQWREATWRSLERDLRSKAVAPDSIGQYSVQLREPLDVLEALWVQRLERRVPLQYLTSSAFWRDMVLSVGPGVLIPRPETELMIDFAIEAVAACPQLAEGQWVDLGTGSGALAVGLARALPQAAAVWAVDKSEVPLAYAAFNAQRLGVRDRLRPVQGSWYEPLAAAGVGPGQVAGILSNPPYIRSEDLAGLQAEVGQHEPHLALDGGEGLAVDCLIPICAGAVRLLQPGGLLALETGGGEQALYVADVLRHMRGSAADAGAASLEGSWTCSQAATDAAAAWGDALASGHGEDMGAPLAPDTLPAFSSVHIKKDLFGVDRFVLAVRA